MAWVCYFVALLWLLEALRLRARLGALAVLEPDAQHDAPPTTTRCLIAAKGIGIDPQVRAAANAYADAEGLDVVDLIASDLPVLDAIRLADIVDLPTYRRNRVARGYSAGYALVVSPELADRTPPVGPDADHISLVRAARSLKRLAPDRTDFLVVPGLTKDGATATQDEWLLLWAAIGDKTKISLRLRATLLVAALAGLYFSPIAAAVAIGIFHAQLLIAFAGLKWRPRRLLATFVFRTPIEAWMLTKTLSQARRSPQPPPEMVERLRAAYRQMATDRPLFDERRIECPLCGSGLLQVWLRTTDLLQGKPGRFTLERCESCGHIFQNPRLSLPGLSFYYGDFYDGLGEEELDRMFSSDTGPYMQRARAVEGLIEPQRWLDVGTGHGHFCCAAKAAWPGTRFDGLDIGASVDEAARIGWLQSSYRGFLPDLSSDLAGLYDVVSLFHCLEHTPDPRADVAAAREVLAPGGCLVVEVPNPECPMGRWLGRFWVPWLQPQHLNLFSIGNLQELLRQQGFEPVRVMSTEVHVGMDLIGAAAMFTRWLAPPSNVPWRPKPTWLTRVRSFAVMTAAFPAIIGVWIVDATVVTPLSRGRLSNAYRIVARRVERVPARQIDSSSVAAEFAASALPG
jgi:SAM-dependent methyltransferase